MQVTRKPFQWFELRIIPDAQITVGIETDWINHERFSHDGSEAPRCPLRIVLKVPVGQLPVLARSIHLHGRYDNAVGERDTAKGVRRKQGKSGRSAYRVHSLVSVEDFSQCRSRQAASQLMILQNRIPIRHDPIRTRMPESPPTRTPSERRSGSRLVQQPVL